MSLLGNLQILANRNLFSKLANSPLKQLEEPSRELLGTTENETSKFCPSPEKFPAMINRVDMMKEEPKEFHGAVSADCFSLQNDQLTHEAKFKLKATQLTTAHKRLLKLGALFGWPKSQAFQYYGTKPGTIGHVDTIMSYEELQDQAMMDPDKAEKDRITKMNKMVHLVCSRVVFWM